MNILITGANGFLGKTLITTLEKSHTINTFLRKDFEQLKKEINELGFEGTGRKYNVSGNAIRKWIKFYEKQN